MGTTYQHAKRGVLHNLGHGTIWSQLILEQGCHKLVSPIHCITAPPSSWSAPFTQCLRAEKSTTGHTGTTVGRVSRGKNHFCGFHSGSGLHQHEKIQSQVWWPACLHLSFWFFLSKHHVCGREKNLFHSGVLRLLHCLHPLLGLLKRCTTCPTQVKDLLTPREGKGVLNALGRSCRF